ncbi:MAG: hypothetical protein K8T89_06575 [Planctomycetes bacterium]|nr:hypothetical protein [Planctomycetota bacterium]
MKQDDPLLLDHDQRFKNLIREFFSDFMHLFYEKWAARFDLDSVEWLDKEVFPDPPEGARRQLDLVVSSTQKSPLNGSTAKCPNSGWP